MTDANRHKGDRSPSEAFGQSVDGNDYDAIRARAERLPPNKKWRFQPDAMERFANESDFLERQLNETRYLSRTARAYLAHLYDEKTQGRLFVRVVPGRMTALLRRGWGLEGMLRSGAGGGKQRDDHRHHAIDAFVVANTTQSLLQQFQHAAASDQYGAEERLAKLTPSPWPGFDRSDVRPFIDRIIVSHKPDHGTRGTGGKTTGKLHKETAYGLLEEPGGGPIRVVIRRNLLDLKRRKDIAEVRDESLRNALLGLWDEIAAAKPELDRAEEERARQEDRSPRKQPVDALVAERAWREGVNLNGRIRHVRRVRVVQKQSVVPVRDAIGRAYKGYVRGGNAFANIWKMPDGSWKTVAVPTFEFNQQEFAIERFRPHPAAKRLMHLHIDDMGAFGEGPERRIVRVRKITNAASGVFLILDIHNEANVAARVNSNDDPMKESRYSAKQLHERGFRKVGVDELGRVRDAGPVAP